MSKRTNIQFEDCLEAINKCGNERFGKCITIRGKGGNVWRIELFRNSEDDKPFRMWTLHGEHHDKYIYSDDLKKSYTNLGMAKEEFLEEINKL